MLAHLRYLLPTLLFTLALLGPSTASAQSTPEQAALRLRYGLSFHSGTQVGAGSGVSYGGMTPNDIAAWAAIYGEGWLGVWAGMQREGVSFSDINGGGLTTQGSLLRASIGPAARTLLGPVRLELSAGYGLAQLPAFARVGEPRLERAMRHAALLGGRALLPLPWHLQAEVRAELPLAFATREDSGAAASSTGFAAGCALLIPLSRAQPWSGSLVLDYQYAQDELVAADGLRAQQALSRVGVALQLTYAAVQPPAPVAQPQEPKLGELLLTVVDADTGQGLPGAQVVLTVGGQPQASRPVDAGGRLARLMLDPGEVLAQVRAEGYLPTEGRATVVPGDSVQLLVRASREPPKTGSLRVTVQDARTKAPLREVSVKAGAAEALTNEQGLALIQGLAPGPLQVQVQAAGFRPAQEAGVVVPGGEWELSMSLLPVGQVVPATISGQVRSTRGGKPLRAWLKIPQAKLRKRTDAQGAFEVTLKQGTYRVIISAPGHLPQTKVLTVQEGEQAILNIDLFSRSR